jgi:hypothetical protein
MTPYRKASDTSTAEWESLLRAAKLGYVPRNYTEHEEDDVSAELPAPLQADWDSEACVWRILGGDAVVATLVWSGEGVTEERAKLFAAAPELLVRYVKVAIHRNALNWELLESRAREIVLRAEIENLRQVLADVSPGP